MNSLGSPLIIALARLAIGDNRSCSYGIICSPLNILKNFFVNNGDDLGK